MTLTARYGAVFKIEGLSPPEAPINQLVTSAGISPAVWLRTDVSDHIASGSEKIGFGALAMTSIFNVDSELAGKPLDERIKHHVGEEKERLEKLAGAGVFIVIEDVDADVNETRRITNDELDVVWDPFPEGYFKNKTKPTLDATIAAIAAALPSNAPTTVKRLFDYCRLFDQDGQSVRSLSMTGTATMSVARAVPVGWAERVASYVPNLQGAAELRTPIRLLSESAVNHSSGLYSFVLAWAALEILTQKLFRSYRIWDVKLAEKMPEFTKRYFEFSKKFLDERINLGDRFVIVAETLNPAEAEVDVEEFLKLKKARDIFFHDPGQPPDPEPMRVLAAKYIRLHVEEQAAGQ